MTGTFDRNTILRALKRLAELLAQKGVQGEICLLGGTVMVLAFKVRPSTKDVDAIFQPVRVIRELARIVQEELDLPENWINDAAKDFVSGANEAVEGDLPQFENLRVTAPVPEYLLAMKCLAARIPGGSAEVGDIADIRKLSASFRGAGCDPSKIKPEALSGSGKAYRYNANHVRSSEATGLSSQLWLRFSATCSPLPFSACYMLNAACFVR